MKRLRKHSGFTFVELVASMTILAIAIVPASKYLTDSMTLRRSLEWNDVMLSNAIMTIEQQMAAVNGAFTTTKESGTLASRGFANLSYDIIRSDSSATGGIPGLLMSIKVRVWLDENNNQTLDANERVVELQTKMARSVGS